jgi:DNA-binding PadR family transcriptional regulator
MKPKHLPEELQQMLPLSPATFFVLFSLTEGERHGYAIMQDATKLSDGKVRMGPGTLYATLQRLLDLALIEEVHGAVADADSRRRYYRLAGLGRALLEAEIGRMESVLRLARGKKLVPRSAD